jgi:hypothetical protein
MLLIEYRLMSRSIRGLDALLDVQTTAGGVFDLFSPGQIEHSVAAPGRRVSTDVN